MVTRDGPNETGEESTGVDLEKRSKSKNRQRAGESKRRQNRAANGSKWGPHFLANLDTISLLPSYLQVISVFSFSHYYFVAGKKRRYFLTAQVLLKFALPREVLFFPPHR